MGDFNFDINLIYTIQTGNYYFEKDNKTLISISERDFIHFNKRVALLLLEKMGLDIENIKTIRYYDYNYKGWIILSDKEIKLKKEKNPKIKLLIQINDENIDNKERIKKIKQRIVLIGPHLEENILKNPNGGNLTITRTPTINFNNLDVCILFSNPLIEIDNDGNKIYLKSIYDFIDNVTIISELIQNLYINFEINIGTINNLKRAIEKKTKILHIISKSSYDDKGNICLEFENNKCELERLNYDKLKTIFNDNEFIEFKKTTLLIINTEFAEEILDLFKSLNFEKIIVEHTTTTTLNLTKKFNAFLYDNLILDKIKTAFEKAKNYTKQYKDLEICCCFHKHKEVCKWKLLSMKNKDEAHFSHLHYKCSCKNKHKSGCDNIKNNNKFIYNNKNLYLCCCQNEKNHNIENALISYFSDEKQITLIEYYNFYKEELNLPKYNEMGRLIGRNNIFYDIYTLFFTKSNSGNHFINVYGNDVNGYNTFGLDLVGFLTERINDSFNNFQNKFVEYIDLKSNFNNEINFENEKIYIINALETPISQLKILINNVIYRGKLNFKTVLISYYPINNNKNKLELTNLIEIMKLNEFDYKLLYIKQKGERSKKEFDELIETKTKNTERDMKLSLISLGNSQNENIDFGNSQNSNINIENSSKENILNILKEQNTKIFIFQEIISLFQYSQKGLYIRELQLIFPKDSSLILSYLKNDLKNIILENKNKKLFIYNEDKKKIKKILKTIKEKNIEKLIIFYSNEWKRILNSFPKNDSFTEFSAGQNFGIWKSLKENDKEIINNSNNYNPIENTNENLNHLYYNFKNLFTLENLKIIYQNQIIWNNVHNYIENLTIDFTSFMKIIKNYDFELRKYTYDDVFFFDDLFETFPNDFLLANERMNLFKQLLIIFESENPFNNNNLIQLNDIFGNFEKLNCFLGEIEVIFSIGVAYYKKSKDLKECENYLLKGIELINNIEKEKENNSNFQIQRDFLLIYKKKFEYFIIKYRMKENIFNNNDENNLIETIEIFSKFGKKKFEIKTYKLLCEWYRKQYILFKIELKSKIFSDKLVETIIKAYNKCKEYKKNDLFNIINKYISKCDDIKNDKLEEIKNIINNNI